MTYNRSRSYFDRTQAAEVILDCVLLAAMRCLPMPIGVQQRRKQGDEGRVVAGGSVGVVAEEVLLDLGVEFGSQFHHHILELRHLAVDELAEFGVLRLLLPHHCLQLSDSVLRFLQFEPQTLCLVWLRLLRLYGVLLVEVDFWRAGLESAGLDGFQLFPIFLQLLLLPLQFFLLLLYEKLLHIEAFPFLLPLPIRLALPPPLPLLSLALHPLPQFPLDLRLRPQLSPQFFVVGQLPFELLAQTAVFVGEVDAFLHHFDVGGVGGFGVGVGGRVFVEEVVGEWCGAEGAALGGGVGVDFLVVRGQLQQPLCPLLQLFQILSAHQIISIAAVPTPSPNLTHSLAIPHSLAASSSNNCPPLAPPQSSARPASQRLLLCGSFCSYLRLLQPINTRLPHIVQISMIKILSLLALLVLAASFTEENGVLTLAESDFPAVLQQFPFLMVKFYTPWCGHCKKLAPIYEELAAELASSHPQVKLAHIDCEAHPKIQSLYKVQGFPTLFFFKNGKESTFGGPRNKEFMTHWINKKIQDPVIPADAAKLGELEKDGKVNVVFYGDLNTPQGTNLVNVAKNDDYNMYYNIRTPEKAVGSLEIFRPFGQTVKLDVVDYNVKSWINLYDRPIVYVFDDRTRGEIFTDKKNAILLFEPSGELGETVRAAFRDAAQEWKIQNKKKLIFSGIQSSEEAFAGFTDHIKIDAATNPIVYVKSAEKLKYLYPGNPAEITPAKIIDFIKGVEAKKVRKYKLEEEARPVKKTEEL